jgi:hypothetical protein
MNKEDNLKMGEFENLRMVRVHFQILKFSNFPICK